MMYSTKQTIKFVLGFVLVTMVASATAVDLDPVCQTHYEEFLYAETHEIRSVAAFEMHENVCWPALQVSNIPPDENSCEWLAQDIVAQTDIIRMYDIRFIDKQFCIDAKIAYTDDDGDGRYMRTTRSGAVNMRCKDFMTTRTRTIEPVQETSDDQKKWDGPRRTLHCVGSSYTDDGVDRAYFYLDVFPDGEHFWRYEMLW